MFNITVNCRSEMICDVRFAPPLIAECLSVRLLIVQCIVSLRLYVYPSHFNCMGAVSVVSSPDYQPCGTGLTRK